MPSTFSSISSMILGLVMAGLVMVISSFLFSIFRKKKNLDLEEFVLSTDTQKLICSALVTELEKQLVSSSTTSMLPTFVNKFPNGNEEGQFIAVDVGGTNIRILLISLHNSHYPKYIDHYFQAIPEQYKQGSGYSFFDFIAIEIIVFIQKRLQFKKGIPLGFTFSFPLQQTSINSGLIIKWNKDFECKDVLLMDPVFLLESAFKRKGCSNLVRITTLVNDAVATLLAGIYFDPHVNVGMILGTGSNASCIINLENNDINNISNAIPVVINTEFGALDIDPLLPFTISTKYDYLVDECSTNPGEQKLEKMISGRYLGELVTVILKEFDLEVNLSDPLTTIAMNRIERDENFIDSDIYKICSIISTRSAQLSACLICALYYLSKEKDNFVVAIDGSLFEKYYKYSDRIKDAIDGIIGSKTNSISLFFCKDGSSIGAAISAALYS